MNHYQTLKATVLDIVGGCDERLAFAGVPGGLPRTERRERIAPMLVDGMDDPEAAMNEAYANQVLNGGNIDWMGICVS